LSPLAEQGKGLFIPVEDVRPERRNGNPTNGSCRQRSSPESVHAEEDVLACEIKPVRIHIEEFSPKVLIAIPVCARKVIRWLTGGGSRKLLVSSCFTQMHPLEYSGKVLIIGCGNILLGDDGFGPAVAGYVSKRYRLSESIKAEDMGTRMGLLVMDLLYGDELPLGLVIVDAADFGGDPGELREVSLEELEARGTDVFGFHDFPSPKALKDLRDKKKVEVHVLACQPSFSFRRGFVRMGLSRQVASAVPVAARKAVALARGVLAHKRLIR
jgi:coenzyme F420 hydrogenase subunit delta